MKVNDAYPGEECLGKAIEYGLVGAAGGTPPLSTPPRPRGGPLPAVAGLCWWTARRTSRPARPLPPPPRAPRRSPPPRTVVGCAEEASDTWVLPSVWILCRCCGLQAGYSVR